MGEIQDFFLWKIYKLKPFQKKKGPEESFHLPPPLFDKVKLLLVPPCLEIFLFFILFLESKEESI